MKNIYRIFSPILLASVAFVSCISDSETSTSPECAIVSFAVSDIESSVTVKKSDGMDTIVTRTLSSSDIYFNIDQNNGLIYSVDSLPKWTDLTKVVPTFSSYGNVYGQTNIANSDSTYYYITSGSDSIDFSSPLKVVAISTDGLSFKHYTIDIRKKTYNSDTLEWKAYSTNYNFGNDNRLLSLNDKAYMFFQDELGQNRVATSTEGTTWDIKDTICVDYSSALVFGDKFYALSTDSCLYTSDDATTWSKVSEKRLERLLAADDKFIYAYDGNSIIGSKDLEEWTVCGDKDLEYLPTSRQNSFFFSSRTNSDITMTVMVGINDYDKNHSMSWYKVTSANDDDNQDWGYMKPTADNAHSFPYLDKLSVVMYKNVLYAIGQKDGLYDYLYRSTDNGIAWWPLESKYLLPERINECVGTANTVIINDQIWIIRGRYLWKGAIR